MCTPFQTPSTFFWENFRNAGEKRGIAEDSSLTVEKRGEEGGRTARGDECVKSVKWLKFGLSPMSPSPIVS